MLDVKTVGALGNGCADDTAALQRALDSGEVDIYIPQGTYVVSETLLVPSHRHITAARDARLVLIPRRPMEQRDFLISNAHPLDGDVDIWIDGGIWDGGFGHEFNVKNPDLFARNACSGACMNFVGVKRLKLMNLIVANTIVYHIRMGRVDGFEIRNVGFSSEKLAWNQDGVHLSGDCRNGLVEDVRALTRGQTNDDLLALNADDSTQRLENRGLTCGPIENITFRNIYAEDCHTAIRMASIASPIRHIRIENLYAGCRCYAINMDAARYCRTPLFVEQGAFDGVGCIEDVVIENMRVFFSRADSSSRSLICAESNADALVLRNFERVADSDLRPDIPTFIATNLTHERIVADGREACLTEKSQRFEVAGALRELRMDYTR